MERLAIATNKFLDPVCGMDVRPGRTRLVAIYKGRSYWFCTKDCREAFESNPKKVLETKSTNRKGLWGRYLDRLNRSTEGKPLKCH